MSEFSDFLEGRNRVSDSKEKLIAERKETHVAVIKDLFSTIREWLSDSIDKGLLMIEEQEDFGKISTELLLDFKTDKIKISPEPVDYVNNSVIRVRLNNYQHNGDSAVYFSLSEGKWFLEKKNGLFPKLTTEITQEVFESILRNQL